eukprot:CAMPEP_0118718370 /NCGR_PEP_ID=MMETSP0800-20121206/28766_1 /TAXON_ID=210618 ORGANISM="Striatella unipunctata, Strain CCMP2910" /NCGR_SAMPLE_ID=MMETSP0800 /ASSEMBLY_ACC=CAM_ASM_000638 /LENGTH=545 /DNA_ID=CAMNT_0006625389 /DNA_START=407 /DNA_END=2044 /DNA_ORIENTATION=+
MGNTRRADPQLWPLYAGWFTKAVYMTVNQIKKTWKKKHRRNTHVLPVPHPVIYLPRLDPHQENQAVLSKDYTIKLKHLPSDLSYVETGKAYQVKDIRTLKEIMDPGRHMIIALVGVTSVGKSSLLKALIGMKPNDETIPVRTTANTTIYPTLVKYPQVFVRSSSSGGIVSPNRASKDQSKERHATIENTVELFVLDMPGVHGGPTEKETEFLKEHVTDQLDVLREVVKVCCLVTGDTINSFNIHILKEIHSVLGNLVMVIRNKFHYAKEREYEEARNELRDGFQECVNWSGDDPLVVMDVRLRRGPGCRLDDEEGVEDVKKEILKFARGKYHEAAMVIERERARGTRSDKPGVILDAGVAAAQTGLTKFAPAVQGGVAKAAESAPQINAKVFESVFERGSSNMFSSATDSVATSWIDETVDVVQHAARRGRVVGSAGSTFAEQAAKSTAPGVTASLVSGAYSGACSGLVGLPIGLACDTFRCAIGRGPPCMKEQVATRVKNVPTQVIASSIGAAIGTAIMPGLGTTVGTFAGSMVSNIFLEFPTK